MTRDLENPEQKIAGEHWQQTIDTTNAADLANDARTAADSERQMSLWEGFKAYPKAVGWSVLISASTTMDGYDTGFLTSLFGLVRACCPSFHS